MSSDFLIVIYKNTLILFASASGQQARMLLAAQFRDGIRTGLPGFARDAGDQKCPDAVERIDGMRVSEFDAGRQQRRDVFSEATRELLQHPLFGHGTTDRVAFERQVVFEASDERVRVERKLLVGLVQVK